MSKSVLDMTSAEILDAAIKVQREMMHHPRLSLLDRHDSALHLISMLDEKLEKLAK